MQDRKGRGEVEAVEEVGGASINAIDGGVEVKKEEENSNIQEIDLKEGRREALSRYKQKQLEKQPSKHW